MARRSSTLAFIVKASRPGLWATALWFYLLPLGRRHVFHSPGFWLGLIYVTLPLGLIIYGWNDIADAEIDRFNPRKGTFLFGARGSSEQLRRLHRVYGNLQLSALRIKEPSAVRYPESSRISPGFRSKQLAESRATTAL